MNTIAKEAIPDPEDRPLSPAEIAVAEQAARDEAERIRTDTARRVLEEAILDFDMPWHELIEQPTAGEVAAKLYATWAPVNRGEPFIESEYANTGIYADLEAALNAHGLATYNERCAELGKRLVDSARAYIFRCHDNDSEDAERSANERRQEYLKQLARGMA